MPAAFPDMAPAAAPGSLLEQLGDPVSGKRLPRIVAMHDRQIERHDTAIRELMSGCPACDERYRIPVSIPGIGPAVAAALIGVAPMARDRGVHSGVRRVAGGRRRPGDLLCMAARSATSPGPRMIAFCRRLRDRGRHHGAALLAVMRKPVVTADALLRDRRTWSERAPA